MNPLVTIAIPTYNRASLIKDAVTRALAQTYSNIEVLVSDNASTDNTLEVLKSISDPRLRIVRNPSNVGHVANFNNCIREARGEYLVIVPDDDIITETFVERAVDLIRKDPSIQAVVAVCDFFFTDENRRRRAIRSKRLSSGIWDGWEILKEFLREKLTLHMTIMITRTELLRRFGGYNVEYQSFNDIATGSRILLTGRAGLINDTCITGVLHASSITTHLGIDYCFQEMCSIINEVEVFASRAISDARNRREFRKVAIRRIARAMLDFGILYRKQGATLPQLVRQLWTWRSRAQQCSFIDFMAVLRLKKLALLLLPLSLTKFMISVRESLRSKSMHIGRYPSG
ncbi:MAG TPA: glycosyltransferase [Xanthobacteraceae bacterium]|nr:glycosyltransferase [Xanthobacteraceae bacterium]